MASPQIDFSDLGGTPISEDVSPLDFSDLGGVEVEPKTKQAPFKGFANAAVTGAGQVLQGASYFGTGEGEGVPMDVTLAEPALPATPRWRTTTPITTEPVVKPLPKNLVEQTRDTKLYKLGQQIVEGANELYPLTEAERRGWMTKLGEGIGGFVPLVASGPLAPATIAVQSMGAHLANDYDELKKQGLSESDAAAKTIDRALLSGISQGTIFLLLPKPLRQAGLLKPFRPHHLRP